MAAPRAILGCAGGRIRVILGETGSDYLYYLDEDDGDREWQTCNWTVKNGGPPNGLCKQINNMFAKGRHVTSVDYDCSGQWFVKGQKRDGSGSHAWWGGTSTTASDEIKEWISTGKVYFGDLNPYSYSPIWVVVKGTNGYSTNGISGSNLIGRMKKIHDKRKSINFVRCFNVRGSGPGYYISDDEGTEWQAVGVNASEELKSGGGGRIFDVSVARDGSWIVIRENSYVASTGVAQALQDKLNQFYRDHRRRQTSRRQQIKAHEKKMKEEREAELRRQEAERLQAEERTRAEKERARMEAAQKAKGEAKARLEAAQKAKAEAEREALKRQCDDADNLRQIQAKRLKPMERVTAIGFSSEPGDAIVKKIDHGSVEVVKPLHPEEQSFIIKDPRLLTQFHTEQDTTSLTLLCYASDKYEAAISMYHCACYDGMCHCTKIASAKFLPESILSSSEQRLLASPPPRPVIENEKEAFPMLFDEYKCSEKIDMRRLKEIAADLESDSDIRASWLEKINRNEINCSPSDLKILQRCHALEEIVKALVSRLSPLPMDNNGCVVYEVNYEHRDNAGRGRLFAIGENVELSDSKYPRTATLQGMQSDLRAALAGKFAHDIDCANSEVRLICSIAKQLGMKDLIPTIFDYRDRRVHWLRYIEEVHKISESDAKRLVNIILSGGRYETWLKSVNISASFAAPTDMKKFYFKLYSEIHALRDQLLQHPKFKWTEVEREKLKKEGRPTGLIDSSLMPRIVQSCENEVLGIIHRIFTQHNWTVRAKVFDGLVVEPGRGIRPPLEEVNEEAENVCRLFGWDIQLVEKPLHGEVATPVTIEKARAVVRQLSGRSSSTRTMGTIRVIRRQW